VKETLKRLKAVLPEAAETLETLWRVCGSGVRRARELGYTAPPMVVGHHRLLNWLLALKADMYLNMREGLDNKFQAELLALLELAESEKKKTFEMLDKIAAGGDVAGWC
jgi:hypothetical protein